MDTAAALERVRKLLALAGSPNEHEAASAAALAQSIMDEHAITQAMLAVPDEDPASVADGALMSGRRLTTWRFRLAATLAHVNGCALMRWRSAGNVEIRIAGRATDVATTRYLYDYLVRAIDRFAEQRTGRGAAFLNAYRAGMVDTLGYRLRQAKAETRDRMRAESTDAASTERAIVRVDARKADAQAAVDAECGPDAKVYRPSNHGGQDHAGRVAGRLDGERVALGEGRGLSAPARQIAGQR